MNKSAQTKMDLVQLRFQKYYEQIKNKYTDDRRLFQNIYEMLIEAIVVMGAIDNNYIWVAYNQKFNEDLNSLEEIKTRFEEMGE